MACFSAYVVLLPILVVALQPDGLASQEAEDCTAPDADAEVCGRVSFVQLKSSELFDATEALELETEQHMPVHMLSLERKYAPGTQHGNATNWKKRGLITLDWKLCDVAVHSNLGGMGPDKQGAKELRFYDVGSYNGQKVDLVIKNETEYHAYDITRNTVRECFAVINMLKGTTTKFVASFVVVGSEQRQFVSNQYFSILDLDCSATGAESLTLDRGFTKYFLDPLTELGVMYGSGEGGGSTAGQVSFVATTIGAGSDNPPPVEQIQRKRTVTLLYMGKASFAFTLGVTNSKRGRNFLFAGKTTLVPGDGDDDQKPSPTPAPTKYACTKEVSTKPFRFMKPNGMPADFEYPLSNTSANQFAEDTNAISLRLFDDKQVRDSLNGESSLTALDEKVFKRDPALQLAHPDSENEEQAAKFWKEFEEVVAVQKLRDQGRKTKEIFGEMHPLFDEDETIQQSAMRVYGDWPADWGTDLWKMFQDKDIFADGAKLDKDIFGQCTHHWPDFINSVVSIVEFIGCFANMVIPAAFAVKWADGRARPEEVAWHIHENLEDPECMRFSVSDDIQECIAKMKLTNMADFTAYKSTGCPNHPSYPAGHATMSMLSTWMPIVADLSDEQVHLARLLDYSVAYFRTLAGVHYTADNKAGTALGQHILNAQLPDFLATRYGCDPESENRIREKVNAKIAKFTSVEALDWATWQPNGWTDPVQLAASGS